MGGDVQGWASSFDFVFSSVGGQRAAAARTRSDAGEEDVDRPGDLVTLIGDGPGAAKAGPTHRCDQPGRKDQATPAMKNLGVEMAYRRIVRKQGDDDDGRVRRQERAFHDDEGDSFEVGDIEAGQSVHEDAAGPTMILAAGWPFRSCHSAWAAKASAFSASQAARRASATAFSSAASATDDTLMPSTLASSRIALSSESEVLRFMPAVIGLQLRCIPKTYTEREYLANWRSDASSFDFVSSSGGEE